uniref:Uncharacterized protein n=1 Tax=Aegilops tauschii subsp. strangulata TaxID=200361 RepID=A0A453CBV1_AEGTS
RISSVSGPPRILMHVPLSSNGKVCIFSLLLTVQRRLNLCKCHCSC